MIEPDYSKVEALLVAADQARAEHNRDDEICHLRSALSALIAEIKRQQNVR